MSKSIQVVKTINKLHATISAWKKLNLTIGLVPTMGALHLGHFSLIKQSLADNDKTCVSIFVNPGQFGPNEDFLLYPRDINSDLENLSTLGTDLVYVPFVEEMYPEGSVTKVSLPGLGEILEGKFRKGFFVGVSTVVAKFLIQILPDRAYFGEKDYQQLCVVKRMVLDLNLPVDIVGCPTVREKNGLAFSSRNHYLSREEKKMASGFYEILLSTGKHFCASGNAKKAIARGEKLLLQHGFNKVDYISICNPSTLEPLCENTGPGLVLGAVWIGETRLIDNIKF